jgi:hypothetical protein
VLSRDVVTWPWNSYSDNKLIIKGVYYIPNLKTTLISSKELTVTDLGHERSKHVMLRERIYYDSDVTHRVQT